MIRVLAIVFLFPLLVVLVWPDAPSWLILGAWIFDACRDTFAELV